MLKVWSHGLSFETTEPCPGTLTKEGSPTDLSFIHVSPPREHLKIIGKFTFLPFIVSESGKILGKCS